ncbi:lacC [Symbiodinium sp. KB8]|nr:lacC [Symbiodinium sp. KB8]
MSYLAVQELPAALECNARSEEQLLCAEEREPAETWEQSASSFSPQALGADLAKEVAGVSFMQEGIERADALPRHLHKASVRAFHQGRAQGQRRVLMDSMVSVPMFLALFTLVMLWARCTVALTNREQKEPSTPSAVDAWCVQGAEAECDGKWLCHELIVPRNSRCAVTVPRMLKEGPWTAVEQLSDDLCVLGGR